MVRRSVSVAVFCVCVVSFAYAGEAPSKLKEWASSPQAYFMTAAERAEWASVKTEEEALKFIDAFLARRPAAFAAEVAKRAEMADRYLTLGKTPGSKSLRGKAIILLGPPAAIDVSESRGTSGVNRVDNQSYVNATMSPGGGEKGSGAAGAGGGGGGGLNIDGGMVQSISASAEAGKIHRYYVFTFRGDSARLLDKDEIAINVEADPTTGKDRLASRSGVGDMDRLFEAAAKASLATPQPGR